MDELGRTLMGFRCTDCAGIPKVPDAGSIVNWHGIDVQIMHNGLKVVAGGYHGDWTAHLIRGLQGHHEPQEEAVFYEAMRLVRHHSLIVELGAFWSYYSLWYLSAVPGSRAICVEPDPSHLAIGLQNAELNQMTHRMQFREAWVGLEALSELTLASASGEPLTRPCLNLESVIDLAGGQVIEMLHLDVQGAELPLLRSADRIASRIRFVMASTHHSSISGSPTTHWDCLDVLRRLGAHILVEHSVQESFSGDGLILASFYPHDKEVGMPMISKNKAAQSLFPNP